MPERPSGIRNAVTLVALLVVLAGTFTLITPVPLFGLSDDTWAVVRGLWELLLLIIMAGLVTFALFVIPRGEVRIVRVYGVTCAFLFGAVFLYATLYMRLGLVGPDPAKPTTFGDAIYFSVVTLTTLGYGDFRPAPAARLLAASEALFGYVYLGLLVASIVVRLSEWQRPK